MAEKQEKFIYAKSTRHARAGRPCHDQGCAFPGL